MTGTYRVRLHTLRVVKQQESGGDEPYLVVLGFRSRFLTPGSTSVFWDGPLFELAENAKTGAVLSIPRDMGEITFANVELISLEEIEDGKRPEILGQIVIVFESDATPFSVVRKQINEKVMGEVASKVRMLIEEGHFDLNNPERSVTEAIHEIRRTLIPSVGELINLWLRSWSDPDDLLGIGTQYWVAVDDQWMRTQQLSSMNFHYEIKEDEDENNNARGAHYVIDGAVIVAGSLRSELLSRGHPADSSLRTVMRPEISVRRWLET